MGMISLQQDWRLLACPHEQEVRGAAVYDRDGMDDLRMLTPENAYAMEQKRFTKLVLNQ